MVSSCKGIKTSLVSISILQRIWCGCSITSKIVPSSLLFSIMLYPSKLIGEALAEYFLKSFEKMINFIYFRLQENK